MKSLSFSRSHYLFRNWTVNRLSVPGIHYLLRQLWIHFLLHDFTFYFAKILFTFYFTDSLFYFASISQIYHQSTIYLASLPWIHYIFREFTMNIASILRINFETNLLWIYYEFYYEFCWCFAYILLIHYLSHDSLWIRFAYREYTLILLWTHLVFREFTMHSSPFSRIRCLFRKNTMNSLCIFYFFREFIKNLLFFPRIH